MIAVQPVFGIVSTTRSPIPVWDIVAALCTEKCVAGTEMRSKQSVRVNRVEGDRAVLKPFSSFTFLCRSSLCLLQMGWPSLFVGWRLCYTSVQLTLDRTKKGHFGSFVSLRRFKLSNCAYFLFFSIFREYV